MENGSLQKYELMVIVDSRLGQEEKDKIFKEAADAVVKNGGRVINSQLWLDKHRMTFAISKAKEGSYYLVNYEADGTVNAKMKATLKINERILRFVIARIEKGAAEMAKH
jgi:small subunit ribosomal protein S6